MHTFDEVINRKGTNSLKWDMLKQRFGRDDLLPFWVADMDFRAPEPVLQALREKIDHGIFGYPAQSKDVDLAVQRWLKRRYDWSIDTDAIVYQAGVVPSISFIIQAFTDPGDEIVIQTPVYYPFYDVIAKNNRRILRNPLSFDGQRYEMDLDHLEAIITEKTKMLLLCHPHNPVGRVWKRNELESLAAICEKYDLLVISDEIHADLLFKGQKHIPFASLHDDAKMRTFTCLSPTKTFNLAGIQGSYVVIENETLRRKFIKYITDTFVPTGNAFSAIAIQAAYTHGEQWLEALMEYIEENYHFVKDYVEAHMPLLRVIDSEGTYLIWLDCSKLPFTPSERRQWLIDEAKLALNHGAIFGEEGKDFERLNLACPRETLREGMERLRYAYEKSQF